MERKIIGKRINSALAEKDIKQKELAKKIGVNDNVISYWCSGSRTPNTQQTIQICNVLGVSADYLLGLTDVATTDKDLRFVCDYTGLDEKTVKILNSFKKNNKYINSVMLYIKQLKNIWSSNNE